MKKKKQKDGPKCFFVRDTKGSHPQKTIVKKFSHSFWWKVDQMWEIRP